MFEQDAMTAAALATAGDSSPGGPVIASDMAMVQPGSIKPGDDEKPPAATGEARTMGQGSVRIAHAPAVTAGFMPPPAMNYFTYRKMRTCPTIAMARVAATAAIKAATTAFTVEDDAEAGADEAKEWLEDCFDKCIQRKLVRDMLLAVDYGWQGFEKVWEYDDEGGRLCIKKFKPLRHEWTQVLCDKGGDYVGMRQRDVTLSTAEAFLFTYDEECGDYYGRSRHENVRTTAWNQWRQTSDRLGTFVTKISGVLPVVEYPVGTAKDANGSEVDTFLLAEDLLRQLSKGVGVAMPNILAKHFENAVKKGIDVGPAMKAWQIQFLETTAGHGSEMVEILQYLEKNILRGWLVPERSVSEAVTAGSRADSVTAADATIQFAQELLTDIYDAIDEQAINPMLIYNFGKKMAGQVKLVPAPLSDETKALVRSIVNTIFTTPTNTDLTLRLLDFDEMVDSQGLPRAIDTSKLNELLVTPAAPGNSGMVDANGKPIEPTDGGGDTGEGGDAGDAGKGKPAMKYPGGASEAA